MDEITRKSPRFPIGQGSRYLGRRGRRGGGTSRAVRSRSCWRQEPLDVELFHLEKKKNKRKTNKQTKKKQREKTPLEWREKKKIVDQMSTWRGE